jgi:hypothetical protein
VFVPQRKEFGCPDSPLRMNKLSHGILLDFIFSLGGYYIILPGIYQPHVLKLKLLGLKF